MLGGAQKIQNGEEMMGRPKTLAGILFGLIQAEAVVYQGLFHLIGQADQCLPGKLLGVAESCDPDAKMLMNAVTVVKTPMKLIGGGQDHVSPADVIDPVLHAEGNITAEIYIDLVKIMKMVRIVPDVIDRGELLLIGDLHGNGIACGQQGRRLGRKCHRTPPFGDAKVTFFAKNVI